jgi:hypothetical protein
MSQQPDTATNGTAVRGEVLAKHYSLTGTESDQASTDPQQRGLSSAIRPAKQKDLSGVHVKIHSSESRKSADKCDGGTEVDNGRHSIYKLVLLESAGPSTALSGIPGSLEGCSEGFLVLSGRR